MTNGPSAKAEQAERQAIIKGDQQSKLRPGEHEPSTIAMSGFRMLSKGDNRPATTLAEGGGDALSRYSIRPLVGFVWEASR